MKKGTLIAVPILLLAVFVVGSWMLLKNVQIDVLNPSGEVAMQQRSILFLALFLSSLVVVPVFTMLVFFSVKYRANNTKASYQPEWAENRILESLWWGIPIAIISVLGVVTYQTSHSLDPYKALAGGKSLEVQVVALQWKWLFLYPEQKLATVNHLPIPVGRPVHFLMTANAPMSAFWIPALGSQVYAMNGMASQLNLKATKPGNFTGYTTNINGSGYAKMKFTAKALAQKDFDTWVVGAKSSKDTMGMSRYDELAKPVSLTSESTYLLADETLFDQIIAKSGDHGGASSDGSAHKGMHE